MTSMPGAEGKGGRELADDHDLLTFDEVKARIVEELDAERERLATLEQTQAVEPELEVVRTRIRQLGDAASRNSHGSHGRAGGFFDYSPGQA